jgi:hypothetical protein
MAVTSVPSAARRTPADFADEIREAGGPWSLGGGRFRPPGASSTNCFGPAVTFGGGVFWSEVYLDWRPLPEARKAAEALGQSGYEILRTRSKPFHARRPLHGLRELDAEVNRLLALSHNPTALAAFPRRPARRHGLPEGPGPFPIAAFDRMRHAHRWNLEWVCVGRKAAAHFIQAPRWSTAVWCLFLDDPDERWIDVDVHLYKKGPRRRADNDTFAHLTRKISDLLGPIGYRSVKLNGLRNRLYAVWDKRLPSLSTARRERARLDRVVFGD